jgi:two-component system NtrC family sensor kinase
VVRDTLRLVSKTLEAHARVSVDLRPVPLFTGEVTSLAQVVMNLLTNAAHAVDQTTGRDKQIKVSTYPSGQNVVLAVEDNGGGMTREVQERIFDAFYTTKNAGEGTGLGLALCRDIAHRHGGTLRCESAPGEGSRFELILPVDRPPQPAG